MFLLIVKGAIVNLRGAMFITEILLAFTCETGEKKF